MDGIVLAIDGQKRFALPARFSGDQFSRSHQAFLISQPNCLACLDRFISGFEARDTHDAAHDKINIRMSCHPHRSRRVVNHFNPFHSLRLQMGAKSLRIDFRAKRDELGFPAPGLFDSGFHVTARR